MLHDLLEGEHPQPRRGSAVAFCRGLLLLFTGLYAISDPFEFTRLAFPLVGAVLIIDGMLGYFGLDANEPAHGRLVSGLIRSTLEVLAGLTVLGGLSVVRLAPQEALVLWLAGILALCGLVEILPALALRQSWRKATSLVGGSGLLAIAGMLFLSPGADLVALMSTVGAILVVLGLVLMSASIFHRDHAHHAWRKLASRIA